MHIPLSIILDGLKYQHFMHLPNNDEPAFKWVHLLDPKATIPSIDFLQVCTLSEALDFSSVNKGCYYLCLRDRIEDNHETEQTLQGMIIVNENINLRELFNHVQEIFIKINHWIMEMQRSIVEKKNIQYLLDLSEPIIENHIHVLDPTFKLLAYTKKILCDDPVPAELIKNGYHQEDSIKKIQGAGRIKLYNQTDEIIIDENFDVTNFVTLERVYRYNQSYTVQVILVCCRHEYSKGQIELFRILTNYIKFYVDKIYGHGNTYRPYYTLIHDLIEGSITNKRVIKQRAEYVNIPYNTTFNLYKISFIDHSNIPINHLIEELYKLLFPSKVIIYNQNIVILNIYKEINPTNKSKQNIGKIQHLLTEYGAICGISHSFSTLSEIQTAYKQANAAVRLGHTLSNANLPKWGVACNKGNDRAFKFEDYYIYYILEQSLQESPEMLEKSFCIEALEKLQEYDLQHNLEYMKILYYYLQSESRPNQAAKILNMHRNNVVYHLKKITKLIGADLEDPNVRLKIKIGYKLLALKNSKGSQRHQND